MLKEKENNFNNIEITYLIVLIGFSAACLYMMIETINNFVKLNNSMSSNETIVGSIYILKTLFQIIFGLIASIYYLKNNNSRVMNYIFITLLLIIFKINNLEYNSFPLTLGFYINIKVFGIGINLIGFIPLIIYKQLERSKTISLQDNKTKYE